MSREERLKLWSDSGLDINKPIFFTEEVRKNPPEYLSRFGFEFDLNKEYHGLPNYINEARTLMAIDSPGLQGGIWVRREDITN